MQPTGAPQEFEKYIKFATAMGIATQLYTTRMEQKLSRFGLTAAQFSILNHLARRMPQGQSVTAIASAVEVKQPAVSKTVVKFEQNGWVHIKPAPDDARAKVVLLTEKGGAHLKDVQRALLPDYQRMLTEWSDEELSALTGQLFRLIGWLDENRL